MKNLSFFLAICILALSSCHNHDDDEVSFVEVNLKGSINVTPQKVYEGESLSLELTNVQGLDALDNVNNKSEYDLKVEYFIDGNSVGSGCYKSKNNFAFNYIVKDLSIGSHTVSAICKSGNKLKVKEEIASGSFTVMDKMANAIDLSMDTRLFISKDLFEFVTPILTYKDARGEYKIEITPEMCEEGSFTVGERTFWHNTCDYEIKACIIPTDINEVKLTYEAKENVSPNIDKRYYLNSNFNINSYSYVYQGIINIQSVTDISINLNINIATDDSEPDDGLIGGKYVAEYVNQLCASTKTVTVVLNEDGTLTLGKQ